MLHISKSISLSCLFLLALAIPAAAQDQVGIFWDTDHSQTTLTLDSAPGNATGYVVITDPSVAGGIVGWELCVEKTGGGFIHSWDIAGQAINLESEPCFSVALSEPLLPTGNTILLATFQTYMSTGEPALFNLSHIPSPQGGHMSYVPAADTRYPIPLTTASYPVAQLLTDAAWAIYSTDVLDFESRPTGGPAVMSVVVENSGGSDLELDIGLSPDCAGFSLDTVSGLVTVPAGASLTVPVTFTPLTHEPYACALSFGGIEPTIPLLGSGREPNYQYVLYTDRDFGELFVGDTRDMEVVIRNTGVDPIPLVPELLACGDDFTIVSGGEAFSLARWESHSVFVRFQPAAEDSFACALSFGGHIDQVGLFGTARASGLYYDIPAEVVYGQREAGLYLDRTIYVRNTGNVAFTLTPELVGCGDEFAITYGGQVGTLVPGYTRQIRVRFQPGTAGDFACALGLGTLLPDVQLLGTGTPPTPRWSIRPQDVYFQPTTVGEEAGAIILIDNTGIIDIDLDVQLATAETAFTIVEGAGLVNLGASDNHLVQLRFQPEHPGAFSGSLNLGATIPPVGISGTAVAPLDSCEVSVSELDFVNALVDVPVERTFTVRNRGNLPLTVTPVSDSPLFTISNAPFTLQPGSNRAVYVTFTGAEVGTYVATINLGNEVCTDVICSVTVIPPIDPGPDAIGLFFDEGLSVNEAYPTVGTIFDAYLVLFNPSDPSPIAGWECSLEHEGQIFILSEDYGGPAINIGNRPDYIVSYASPLPSASANKLLSFKMLAFNPDESIHFSLSPLTVPSIPDQMSWITEEPRSFIQMHTTTGVPEVATVYGMAPVSLEVPTPVINLQGAQVHLSWPAPLQPGSTCHVYRRTATEGPKRLTAQPLNAGAGTLTFTDNPEGFDAGTTLFYSYAVIVDGAEQSRSLEVEHTVNTPRILTSRLLPNVPNPFNPMTRIRFELAQSSEVQVSVFDLTGRLVKVLENGNLGAGEYSRTWQGRDESGRPVASGAYYVRLVMNNQVDHQKIMLLK